MSALALPHVLSHAYIVAGGTAAGRTELVTRLAQAYVCPAGPPPCLHCRHCEKAAGGIHPDITVVSPAGGKREITVEQARALRADSYIRPNEAGRKVYIIDPADSLNVPAQNVLLKVVEEGPAYAAFLLPTARPGALLETLRSRCETLALPGEQEEPEAALAARAAELARLLREGDEAALAAWCVEQELAKPTGQEVLDLFQCTETALAAWLAKDPKKAAPLLERLRSFRELRPYNVGAGHLLGALCAGARR